jgi:hypothetical protein
MMRLIFIRLIARLGAPGKTLSGRCPFFNRAVEPFVLATQFFNHMVEFLITPSQIINRRVEIINRAVDDLS